MRRSRSLPSCVSACCSSRPRHPPPPPKKPYNSSSIWPLRTAAALTSTADSTKKKRERIQIRRMKTCFCASAWTTADCAGGSSTHPSARREAKRRGDKIVLASCEPHPELSRDGRTTECAFVRVSRSISSAAAPCCHPPQC